MQSLVNIINRIQNISNQSENIHPGTIKTDFNLLDRLLNGGFANHSLNVIACPGKVGKNALIISLMLNMMKRDVQVGMISLNMSEEEWLERMLSNSNEIWFEKIKRGKLEEHERTKITDLSKLKVFDNLEINAPGYTTLSNLVNTCTQWVIEKNVKIIFIDYLQLISIENIPNKKLRIFTISQTLKRLCVELNVPIIITVPIQPTKNVYSYLEDLNSIGPIEPFADVILYLNNRPADNFPNIKTQNKSDEIFLRICKNKTGALDTIKLRSLLHIQLVEEFDD